MVRFGKSAAHVSLAVAFACIVLLVMSRSQRSGRTEGYGGWPYGGGFRWPMGGSYGGWGGGGYDEDEQQNNNNSSPGYGSNSYGSDDEYGSGYFKYADGNPYGWASQPKPTSTDYKDWDDKSEWEEDGGKKSVLKARKDQRVAHGGW